ncbi:MAG: MMPL family transporter, partial [Bacteroidota bacterium]
DTIHFLAKYRMLRLNGLNVPDAIHVTLRETGKAILFTSMVLVSGFLVFTASTFAGTANMGGLTALSLILALLTNLILLPALLYLFGERHVVSGGGSKPASDFL